MATKDHEFTVGKGQTIWAGKSHYPDLVRLVVPKDQAVALAHKILRAYELARPEDMYLDEIPLYGELEPLDDEQVGQMSICQVSAGRTEGKRELSFQKSSCCCCSWANPFNQDARIAG